MAKALVAVAAVVLALALVVSIGSRWMADSRQASGQQPLLSPRPTAVPAGNGGWNEIEVGGVQATPGGTNAKPSSAGTGGASAAGALIAPRVELSSCGDGTCNADETCGSCSQDCGCGAGDYCTGDGDCRAVEECGDGVCTQVESAGSCCTDCGCGTGNFCNYGDNACVLQPRANQQQLDASIKAFITGSDRKFTDYTVYYEVFKGTPVTVANFVCDSQTPGKDCRTVVYFGSRSEVLMVGNSK